MTGLATALGLVGARIRHRPARGILAAFGVALALAAFCLTLGLGTLAGDLELRRSIHALPAGQRSLTVALPADTYDLAALRAASVRARRALAPLAGGSVRRLVLFRALADSHGRTFWLAGVDDLPAVVRRLSGRLPASCTPARCEVVSLGAGAPTALDASLGIVVVGRVARTDPLVLGGTFDTGRGVPVLLADGVERAAALASLASFQRSYGFVAPVADRELRVAALPQFLRRIAAASDLVGQPPSMVLTAPDDTLVAAGHSADAASRRLLVVGGEIAALLAAFAILAALGLRRDHRGALDLLRRRGARGRVLAAFTAAEAAWPVAVGSVVGVAAGSALVVAAGRHEDVDGGGVLRTALAGAWPLLVVAALATLLVVAVSLRLGDAAPRRRIWPTDVAAAVALAAAALAASRGDASPAALSARADPLLAALPILAVLCGALVAARLAPALLAGLGRLVPARAPLARLALVDVLRRPLRPLVTVAFVVAAVAIAIFAGAYRATLDRGARDQAAFGVPFDFTLTASTALVRPLDLASASRYRALVPGTRVTEVLRQSGVVRRSGSAGDAVEVLGVDPAALPAIDDWRADYGPAPARLANDIALSIPSRLAGAALPAGARRLSVRATGDLGGVEVDAIVDAADARARVLRLAPDGDALSTVLPAGLDGARLVGFTLHQPPYESDRIQHHVGEGSTTAETTVAAVRLAAVRTEPGGPVAFAWRGLTGLGGVTVARAAAAVELHARLFGRRVIVRYPQPTDATTIPVVADPQTASAVRGGTLTLVTAGDVEVHARVVAVARRFPTLGDRFVVADGRALHVALDASDPGTGTSNELWLRTGGGASERALAAALARPPFDRLAVARRTAVEHGLRTDPLARGALALLSAGAVVALALVVIALALVVIADRRDDDAALLALEADGATPRELRGMLLVRVLGLVLVAAPLGVATGLLLARAVTSLVAVTATAAAPVPPLAAVTGPGGAVAGVAIALAVGAAAAALAASRLLREPLPPVPESVGS